MTPYYQDDAVTIYHGDSIELLHSVAPFCDATLTDPPYNVGKDYGVHNDSMSPEDYEQWCKAWWPAVRALSKRIVIFPGHGNLPMWFRIAKPSAIGCWYKPGNGASGVLGFEEWEPYLYYLGDKGLLGGSSVTVAPVGRQIGLDAHPCPKPILLFAKLIKKLRAETILDPFMGTGTTLEAAKNLGRKAIGIEIEERYCEIAAKRCAQGVLDFA